MPQDAFTGLQRRDMRVDSYTGAALPKHRERRLDTSHHPTSLNIRVHATGYLADKGIAEARKAAFANRREMFAKRERAKVAARTLTRAERITRALERCAPEQRDRLIAAAIAAY